jgi:hypothetical protein
MRDEKQTLLGAQSQGEELEIRDFKRIKRVEETVIGLFDGTVGPVLKESREVFINAWSGKTKDGDPVHVSFRVGVLTIEVDQPTQRGCRKPVTVMRWNPQEALGLVTPVPKEVGGGGKLSPKERERLAEQVRAAHRVRVAEQVRVSEASAKLREIRAINGKPMIVSEWEVRHWLEERNRRFKLLSGRNLAGGKLRVRISDPEAAAAA